MTTRTGDVLTTETEIAALPHGSVILDSHGNAAQKVADQWHYPETNPVPDKRVEKYAPVTVLHVPGEQAEPTIPAGTITARDLYVGGVAVTSINEDTTIGQAARVLDDEVLMRTERSIGLIASVQVAQALADAGLLRQEPPTRDDIARAIADHYGTRAGRDNAWDATTDRQRADLLGVADAVLTLLRGGAR